MKSKELVFSCLSALGLLLVSISVLAQPVPLAPQTEGADSPLVSTQQRMANGEIMRAGQVGGQVETAVVDGPYTYIGNGPRLVILDTSTHVTPTKIGQSQILPEMVTDLAISGSFAYVAIGEAGMIVIDVSDPTNPIALGSLDTPHFAYDVTSSGSTVYVADGNSGLQIIDASNPQVPVQLGAFNTPDVAEGVAISGTIVYVASSSSGLYIIDVSKPIVPVQLGVYDTPGTALGVTISGTMAFVADGTSGLQIIDVSDPANTFQIGYYQTGQSARAIAISGSTAYIADYYEGLMVLDVSNPANPSYWGSYDTQGLAVDVAVTSNTAYVSDLWAGLLLFDVSNPANPGLLADYGLPGAAFGIAVDGNLAFAADYATGLQILDVSDPAKAKRIGALDTPWQAINVAVSGTTAYVTDISTSMGGLITVDISDPANPVLLNIYTIPTASAYDVAVQGNLAYVATSRTGLHIVDVTNPANPIGLGTYQSSFFNTGVAVSGTVAYLTNHDSGLHVVDVSNPANPTGLGNYNTPGSAESVTIHGNLAYIADLDAGVHIVDVSNPVNPVLVGTYDTPGFVQSVAIKGNVAIVADGTYGVLLLDVTDPGNPVYLGTHTTAGSAHELIAANDLIYLGDVTGGLWIFGADSLEIDGPAVGELNVPYLFTATVNSISVTLPITFTWEATEQTTIVHTGTVSLTDTVIYSWNTLGPKVITVTVSNSALGTMTSTRTIDIIVPLAGVSVAGDMTGLVNTSSLFTATAFPISATLPVNYIWEATDQAPVVHTGQMSLTDTVTFDWSIPGPKTITVTADNGLATAVATHTITINVPLASVAVSGNTMGVVKATNLFTATVSPGSATTPITYTWTATGHNPVIHGNSMSLTDTAGFDWHIPGPKTITVTAANGLGTVAATHAITINVPPATVAISGIVTSVVKTTNRFTATVSPISATLPVTYSWTATDQAPVIHGGSLNLTDTVSFSWDTPGAKLITVTVTSEWGTVVATHIVTLNDGKITIYLPVILKPGE